MLDQMEKKGKFKYEDGEDSDDPYYDENSDVSGDGSDDVYGEAGPDDINVDKKWLLDFITVELRGLQTKYETELNHIRNKKRGGAKKNKEKSSSLVNRLAELKKVKERADELQITMDYLEPGKIKALKDAGKLFLKSEDEAPRNSVMAEIDALVELSEQNRQR